MNNTGVMSINCPGSLGLDFSRTFYGMLNPLLCESKYMDFLSGFKDADESQLPVKKLEVQSDETIELLAVNFYSHLKSKSKRKALASYQKLLAAVIRKASENFDESEINQEIMRASAKEVIEKKLGINVDEELAKCKDEGYAKARQEAKTISRSCKYMTAAEDTKVPNAVQKALTADYKSIAKSRLFSLQQKSISAWESAGASFLGTSQFLAICVFAASCAVLYCQMHS